MPDAVFVICSCFLLQVASQSQFQISVLAGPSAVPVVGGDVVMVADSGAVVTSVGSWTYLVPANITSVTPSAGSAGLDVVISGEGLRQGGDRVAIATLAGITAVIVSESDTEVVLRVGSCGDSCPERGDVVLTSDTGAQVLSIDAWKYGRIDSVVPPTGQLGVRVTISGQGLELDGDTVANVVLAGINVSGILFRNDSLVVATAGRSPATGDGSVDVISNTGTEVSVRRAFRYHEPSSIATIIPTSGQKDTVVVLHGQGFRGRASHVTGVTLAGYPATITFENDTYIRVTASSGAAAISGEVCRPLPHSYFGCVHL